MQDCAYSEQPASGGLVDESTDRGVPAYRRSTPISPREQNGFDRKPPHRRPLPSASGLLVRGSPGAAAGSIADVGSPHRLRGRRRQREAHGVIHLLTVVPRRWGESHVHFDLKGRGREHRLPGLGPRQRRLLRRRHRDHRQSHLRLRPLVHRAAARRGQRRRVAHDVPDSHGYGQWPTGGGLLGQSAEPGHRPGCGVFLDFHGPRRATAAPGVGHRQRRGVRRRHRRGGRRDLRRQRRPAGVPARDRQRRHRSDHLPRHHRQEPRPQRLVHR